jgi:threonine/homoserine/homoserine lactone efflux protein
VRRVLIGAGPGHRAMIASPEVLLPSPRVKAWLERTTGAVLIALGLRVPVERRRAPVPAAR